MGKDYYKILGIEKSASQDEVKSAFRKLAHQYHPDKAGGDEAKFKEINEAYQVLGNEQKRKQYDQFGSTFDQQGGFGAGMGWEDFMRQARAGGGGFQNINFDFGDMDLGDIFGDVFGFGSSRKKKRSRGQDIQVDLTISFEDAAFGARKVIELYKSVKCPACFGNGAEPGTKITTCATCQGAGRVNRVQQTILGAFQTAATCPDCQGQGKKAEVNCKKCGGYGAVKQTEKIEIEIPAGIDNGQSLRLENKGEAGGIGSQPGDLYVAIRIKPSADFERDGENIYSKAHIKYSQAVLGDKIEIKTINGSGKLSIPSGTQSGEVFKLRGLGLPRLRGYGRGDHYVEVIVDIPKHLNHEQKRLLNEMGDLGL